MSLDHDSKEPGSSPFDEVFDDEELVVEKYPQRTKRPYDNPYEAKPTPEMLALLGMNGRAAAKAATPEPPMP